MDEPFYCARCYAELPMGNTEEAWCDKCDKQILGPSDYLTHPQLTEASQGSLFENPRPGRGG